VSGKEAIKSTLLLSVVTPAFCEQDNLPILHERLCSSLDGLGIDWEWVIIDDHSTDETFSVARDLAAKDSRIRALRLARNSGTHIAILCGLEHSFGDCAAVLMADLQDPPEIIEQLLEKWRVGAQIVWAVRRRRDGEKAVQLLGARIYYGMLRKFTDFDQMPETGADFFLIDRIAIDGLSKFQERNVSVFALIHWMGYRQEQVLYDKQARLHGISGWSLSAKIKLVLDTIISFSHGPIRFISILGMIVAAAGFLYACVVAVNAFAGAPVEGWSSLMMAVLIIGGVQMAMLGMLGEYLWRTTEESRRRPRYLIENVAGRVKQHDREDNSISNDDSAD